ncbi:hypothetical protein E3H11_11910 [Bradyrhizobium brasilense]|uniref:hypothetical protein n=1 Tax=Bradyrhizobium brasilense TaxID=1419277 RepID=UPI001456AEA4|nr:hypothetical protein [Bradyrhizobium brasilense]NLS69609.1 hypothetical protein [Bradyrhizobium brasilense]
MPVKRRVPKQRALSVADELMAWSETFDCGFDFFSDLEDVGIAPSEGEGHPLAEEAWHRLGAEWLRHRVLSPGKSCWALDAFGPPKGA